MLQCYASVVFDDPIIHVVIEEMGGWIRLCHTLLKDLPFRAHEFKKHYVGYVNHLPSCYPKQLIGLEAHQNKVSGYVAQLPLLIGDQKRALTVWKNGSENLEPISVLNLERVTPFLVEG